MDTENTTQVSTSSSKSSTAWLIPGSIVLAGLLVAGAVVFSRGGGNPSPITPVGPGVDATQNLAEVSASDHILGNPDAPVKIVEYSDLECPFCKQLHPTLKQVIDRWGESGEVAWVYRHLPLTSIHPGALPAAVASECAARIGGNVAFWAFIDRYFNVTDSTNSLAAADLARIASDVGAGGATFSSCVADSGEIEAQVLAQAQGGVSAGAEGTPYMVIVGPDDRREAVAGAVSFANLESLILRMLSER